MAIAFVLSLCVCGCSITRDVDPTERGASSIELTVDDMHMFNQAVKNSLNESPFLATLQQSGQPQELFVSEVDNQTITSIDTNAWTELIRADLASQVPGFIVVDGKVKMNKNRCPYIFMMDIKLTETTTAYERNYCYHITARILSRANKFAPVWSMRPFEFRKVKSR
jgi:hypothetical protein